jgi:hypothetical protein
MRVSKILSETVRQPDLARSIAIDEALHQSTFPGHYGRSLHGTGVWGHGSRFPGSGKWGHASRYSTHRYGSGLGHSKVGSHHGYPLGHSTRWRHGGRYHRGGPLVEPLDETTTLWDRAFQTVTV